MTILNGIKFAPGETAFPALENYDVKF